MSRVIAIDFGTTNTVVAEWVSAEVRSRTITLKNLSRIPNPHLINPPSIPSLVYFENAATHSVQIGYSIIANGLDQHRQAEQRLFRTMKRALLKLGNDRSVDIDGVVVTPRLATELFLKGICQSIIKSSEKVDELVLTVPVMAFEHYLNWLASAMTTIQLPPNTVPRVIDEPTAAAFGYGLDLPGGVVLVIDFGGGTLDLSLVRLPEDQDQIARGIVVPQGSNPTVTFAQNRAQITARVVAKTARDLGGDDIDQVFLDWLLRQQGWSRESVRKDLPILLRMIEEAKIELSQEDTFNLLVHLSNSGKSINCEIKRQDFELNVLESPAIGFKNALQDALAEVFTDAARRGVGEKDIDCVLLVGGSTLIPAVREWVQQRFKHQVVYDNPFESVAHGALKLATSHPIEDILHHSYVLEVVRKTSHEARVFDYLPIVQAGVSYPFAESVYLETYLKPPNDGVVEINFVIAEMAQERQSGERKVFNAKGQLMHDRSRQQMSRGETIRHLRNKCTVHLSPPGKQAEENRLDVSFVVDENRRLLLTVFDTVANRWLVRDEPVTRLE